jgi:hypothetical protein
VSIDQLPVLSNLLRALEEISLMGDSSGSRISAFLIQQLPEIRDNLIRNKNWQEIARRQRETFLVENEETRKADMQLLMAGLEDFLEDPICAKCGNLATYRCSKCHNEWYCSRDCQKSAWKQHKLVCHLIKLEEPEARKKKEEAPKVRIEDITKS